MKNIIYLLLVLFIYSCMEDEGNYDYKDNEVITISNIEELYQKLFLNERLVINPEVESTNLASDFEYHWFMSEPYYLRDTISRESVLDTLVAWDPGEYEIVFSAKNLSTGYTLYKTFNLEVITPYSRGLYVLKNEGDIADVDLYTDSLVLSENIISFVNGKSFKGQAQKMSINSSYYIFDPVQNKYVRSKTVFLMTDKDMLGVNITDASITRDFDGYFFEIPKSRPMMMLADYSTSAFINNGKLHSLSDQSYNNGRVGAPKTVDNGYDYNLSKYGYCDFINGILVFDSIGSSFYKTKNSISHLIACIDKDDTEMSCLNNGKELKYLGSRSVYFGQTAYAVMHDKIDPTLRMISRVDVSSFGSSKLAIKNDTLTPEDKAYHADIFTISQTEEVLYFISDGALWSRNVAGKGGGERMQFDIPDGEQVSFIKYLKYKESSELDFNYVVLGTQIGDKYKIRFFARASGGMLNPEPAFTLPEGDELGSGRAGDVLYVSPKVNAFSYIHSY